MEKCGNIFDHGACELGKMELVLYNFDRWLIKFMAYDKFMIETSKDLVKNGTIRSRQFYHMRYEELLADNNRFLDLLEWIGYGSKNMERESESRLCNNCTKSTSDDLRNVLSNYEEVKSWISSNCPCLMRQFLETNPGVVQFPVEYYCDDLFTDRVNRCIEYLKKDGTKLCW